MVQKLSERWVVEKKNLLTGHKSLSESNPLTYGVSFKTHSSSNHKLSVENKAIIC